jgi:flagellar hook assembly protein FlgD
VTLDLYDVSGHRVRRLVDGERVAGRHRVPFDGRDAGGARLASGVYVARLESAAGAARTRIVLLR